MKDKILLATQLLLEIEKHESTIFIIDNYSIVGQDSKIVSWYMEIVKKLRKIERLFICLISRSRVNFKQLLHNEYIFTTEIPELEKYERNALFNALLELEGIQINKKDFNIICELFNGFPEQVFFSFNIIITEGLPYLLDNLNLIPDYNSEKIAHIIQKYESDEFTIQVLVFLSDCEFVSLNLIEEVFKNDSIKIKSVIEEFSNNFIFEFIGATKEYFRLNDAIRDYVQRTGIKLNEKYSQNLKSYVKSTFNNYDTIDRDISEYVITIKEALKKGYDIPNELLLPSHFLNAMRDLYNSERRYNDVIILADRILLQEKYLDTRILREVRYWLCLSLARKRDKRLLEEIQKIEGPDHNFLLGFYYRLSGRHYEAIERLTAVLEDSPNFNRAKRELVQVYLNLDEYDKAFGLAKENYQLGKNNPYHVQNYFRCLIKIDSISVKDKKDELKKLLKNLKDNPHEKANEMYLNANAQYIEIINFNEKRAMDTVDDAISAYPKSIYPPLTKIEICKKFGNWDVMENTLNSIERNFPPDSDILSKLNYLSAKVILLAKKGFINESQNLLDTKIKNNFSDSIYNKLKEEIDSIINIS